MKLIAAQVHNFRSVENSERFCISDLTCLVGKNEAGKSALLQALHAIAPLPQAFDYDRTRDYPRRFLSRYGEHHPDGTSLVVKTWWKLSDADIAAVTQRFGTAALKSSEFTIEYGIGYKTRVWTLAVNRRACLDHLARTIGVSEEEIKPLAELETADRAIAILNSANPRSEKQERLLQELAKCREEKFDCAIIDILAARKPKFFYTSHFDRMSGEISLNQLAHDRQHSQLKIGDRIFLDFLEYAGTTVEELQKATKYEELKARCEAASNDITDEIFQFWSQNDALEVKIELGEGRSQDPPPFHAGTVAKVRIENRNHRASVPLSERSAGFVWFFSFLAQFKQLKKTAGQAIMLLDEPGLTLHGKAQADLLRYIEERLLPTHQVIYSTHSPFIVPAHRMDSIRVVEDVVKRPAGGGRLVVEGTKVSEDVLRVDKDTLFPLQGALGYEITQSLFIGKNTLLLEGPSDILYLQVFSEALRRDHRQYLDPRWTLCPAGGIDKIAPFVALFGANNLNVAVLCDLAQGDKAKVERLRRSEILRAGQLFTAADFTGQAEGDIEDLMPGALYAEILNAAFGLTGAAALTEATLLAADPGAVRLVKKAEAAFRLMPGATPQFDHFTPSQWLLRNPALLDAARPDVASAKERFERVIQAINGCLPK